MAAGWGFDSPVTSEPQAVACSQRALPVSPQEGGEQLGKCQAVANSSSYSTKAPLRKPGVLFTLETNTPPRPLGGALALVFLVNKRDSC